MRSPPLTLILQNLSQLFLHDRIHLEARQEGCCLSTPRGFGTDGYVAYLQESLKRDALMQVKLKISEICSLLDVDGIRGDIVTNRAARALVAFEGRDVVRIEDVQKVIGICINHR